MGGLKSANFERTYFMDGPAPMSKAFDSVNRKTLFEKLEMILEPDKLHLLSILTKTPKLKIKINQTYGELFETRIGIMQGDCLSAVLFIFYLACCLEK